jgi:cobalamin biosynthesis Co2+ chelatase CbiK
MGQMTIPASTVSDAILVFAEPARPDHPILRNIFLEQAQAVSENPKNEILVLVGHGARSNTNDMAQEMELSNAAAYAEKKLKFADSVGVTAREDWPDLQPLAIEKAVSTIQAMLEDTGADNVILVPATGSGSGFDAVAEALDAEGIAYTVAPEPLPFGQDEFEQWAKQTFEETVKFIKKEQPTESTITPYWSREY